MKQSLSEQTCCDHCGDPCDDSIGTIHHFCCYGCKAVYELIRDHDLSGFYNETSLQNKSISEVKAERKYAFLDNKDAQKELLSFHDEELSVVRLSTPAIHCSSCIFLLEHLHHFSDEILRSVVHFGKKEVTVTFQNSFSLKDVAILLSQLGYPPYVSLESLDKTKKHVKKSSLGTKIAVAGFCFGNCMLMSMPDYLDSKMLITDQLKTLFNWINLAFAIPSMLYAGWDYFSSAWKGFLHKNLNVDIPISIGILTLFIRSFYEITTFTGTGYFDSLTGLIFFLLLGKWYQSKTYQALSFERDYTSYFPISVTCLIDGEEYHRTLKELKKGDIVIIHNEELIPADGIIINGSGNIDYSFVTGESTPKSIQNGGAVYAGGRQMGGELVVKLQESVNNSELTQLWNKEEFDKERVNFQSLVDKISVYFTGVILVIAGVSAVYWWLNDQSLIWNSVSAVLIVACPCALALVLPFAYGHAMRVVGKQGLFLRNAHVIETMAKIKSIIFDKTGTLTQNSAEVVYEGDKMTKTEEAYLRSAIGNSSHPLSRIIYQFLPKTQKFHLSDFEEKTGAGFTAVVNATTVKVGSAIYTEALQQRPSLDSVVYIQVGKKRGLFIIKSSYRKGIFKTLKELAGRYKLALLSGDNSTENKRLSPYFDELQFDQKPEDKYHYLAKLKEPTLMVGDGLNDAGALKKAAVGVAVSDDIHQFSPACDAILRSDKTTSLFALLKYSKKVRAIVQAAFVLSFLYNIIGLSFAVSGNLTPLVSAILMPLSSVTVVVFITCCVTLAGKKLRLTNSL